MNRLGFARGLALCVVLASGCGGEGADGDTTGDTNTETDIEVADLAETDTSDTPVGPVTGDRLIVTDSQRSTSLTWELGPTFTGSVAPAASTRGNLVVRPLSLAVGGGELYRLQGVSGLPDMRIEVFDLDTLDGEPLPVRSIAGETTTLNTTAPGAIAIDVERELLYVGTSSGSVLVFSDASTLNGDVAPARTFTSASFDNGFTSSIGRIVFDPENDALWGVVSGAHVVQITEASTRSGDIAVARKLTGVQANGGLSYDASSDTLWVVYNEPLRTGTRTHLRRIDEASTQDGAVTAAAEITVPGTSTTAALGLLGGAAYLVTNAGILVYDGAAALSGELAPTRTVSPPANTLENPAAMVIVTD